MKKNNRFVIAIAMCLQFDTLTYDVPNTDIRVETPVYAIVGEDDKVYVWATAQEIDRGMRVRVTRKGMRDYVNEYGHPFRGMCVTRGRIIG